MTATSPSRRRAPRSAQPRRAAAAFCLLLVGMTAACSGSTGTDAGTANGAGTGTESATGSANGVGPAAAMDGVVLSRFDGTPVRVTDYRGRPLVVNFFASWCAPCIKEMPEFEQVHQDLGDRVAFLGVNVRDRAEDGRRLASQTGVTFDLVRDPSGDLLVAVGGKAMPTTAFVTADGRLALVQSRTYKVDTLRAAIDEVLLAPPDGSDQ